MKWLIKAVFSLYRFWYRFRYRSLSVTELDDIPDQTIPGYLYLIGQKDDYWAATMRCPCGCGDTITLNLIGPHPVWRATTAPLGKVNLHPSVFRKTGCRSHYWIRDSVVVWTNG